MGGLGGALAAAWPRCLVLRFGEAGEAGDAPAALPDWLAAPRFSAADTAALAAAMGAPDRPATAVVVRPGGYVGWRGRGGGEEVGRWWGRVVGEA